MSGPKKLNELPDEDWASALDEWEKTSFGDEGKSGVPGATAETSPAEVLAFDEGTRVDGRAPAVDPGSMTRLDVDAPPIEPFPDLNQRDALDTQERVRRASAIPLADDLPQPAFDVTMDAAPTIQVGEEFVGELSAFEDEDVETNIFTRAPPSDRARRPPVDAGERNDPPKPVEETPIVAARAVRPGGASAPRLPIPQAAPHRSSSASIPARILPAAPPPVPSSSTMRAAGPAEEQELDAPIREALGSRAEWLAEEARLGRSAFGTLDMLVASELFALAGDDSRAEDIATAARERAGAPGLAWIQARSLVTDDDAARLAQSLRSEADATAAPAAKAHALRLSASALRRERGAEHGVALLREAELTFPSDPGATLSLVATDLGKDRETDIATLTAWPELAEATDALARLRGSAGSAGLPPHSLDAAIAVEGARQAFAGGETRRDEVTRALATLSKSPGSLGRAACVLLGAFAGLHASARDAMTAAFAGRPLDVTLARILARRSLENRDLEGTARAFAVQDALEPHERAVLAWLGQHDVNDALDALPDGSDGAVDGFAPLSSALAGVTRSYAARSERVAGSEPVRRSMSLARKLADGAHASLLAEAAAGASSALGGTALLEAARRQGDAKSTAEALAALGDVDHASAVERSAFLLTAAEVARAGGLESAALGHYTDVLALFPEHEAATFAVHGADAPKLLADRASDATRRAVFALEASTAEDGDAERRAWLEKAHGADPTLGIAAFLAERAARREGNVAEVLRWIGERLTVSSDPFERATDAVRDAMLRADAEPELAAARLREAHEIRPEDAGIRELYERMLPGTPEDLVEHRLVRARAAEAATRELFAVEAAVASLVRGDADRAREAVGLFDRSPGRLATLVRDDIVYDGTHSDVAPELEARFAASSGEARRALSLRVIETAGPLRVQALLELSVDTDRTVALGSLRALEHTFFERTSLAADTPTSDDRELAEVAGRIATLLAKSGAEEAAAHAQLAIRIAVRRLGTEWHETRELATLAASQKNAPLWAIRAFNAHARSSGDDVMLMASLDPLIERSYRSAETAALLRRASEASARLGNAEQALAFAERAVGEDPGDVVTWSYVADARSAASNIEGTAEAFESLARSSTVDEYRLTSWIEAARVWQDDANDTERATTALEHAAAIDVTHPDVFARLCSLYAARGMSGELADLLERRLARAEDADERVTLEVDRARALVELGDDSAARVSLESALESRPDHTTALVAYGDLCEREGLYEKAESAWVRLTRLLTTDEEQRAVYERLADLYTHKAVNLSRAEVALREVEKRFEGDLATLEKLVVVYVRQGDFARAVETKQRVLSTSRSANERAEALVDLAKIHEHARELRKAEAVLETARKEQPLSVLALRALAEFYIRQKQMPAVHILLDRVTADAGRAFEAGRFAPELFELIVAAWELRGKQDAAHVAAATLGAIRGESLRIRGAEMRAFDPRFDDRLAPEVLLPALRALMARAGDALDAATVVDLRQLAAQPLPASHPVATTANAIATAFGLPALTIAVSPSLGLVCIPCGARPPTLVLGEALIDSGNDRARAFLLVRALKLVQARASILVRLPPDEVVPLLLAWLSAFNPGWTPEGVDPGRLHELRGRMAAALPRSYDPELGALALEAAGVVGSHADEFASAALAWADRVALLAIGDPGAAAEAIAWSEDAELSHLGADERVRWIGDSAETRDLFAFSVREAYAELREACGIRG